MSEPVECGDLSPLWDFGLGRLIEPIAVAVQTPPLAWPTPRVVSLPIGRPPAIKTRGFVFPRSAALRDFGKPPAANRQQKCASAANAQSQSADDLEPGRESANADAARRPARIKPPGDVIKLEDRLFYLLQPPVAAWMSRESLEFPFKPFA